MHTTRLIYNIPPYSSFMVVLHHVKGLFGGLPSNPIRSYVISSKVEKEEYTRCLVNLINDLPTQAPAYLRAHCPVIRDIRKLFKEPSSIERGLPFVRCDLF